MIVLLMGIRLLSFEASAMSSRALSGSSNGSSMPRKIQPGGRPLASFRSNLEKLSGEAIPSLMDMESGKLVGAVLPMSERAQIQMRNSIEVIEYLLNQEQVIWS
ncbi:MAG: hypothetical protein KF751_18660 [Nitrospira sp.]|uniref:hypothetical protein n=1 Tax=Nitrospira sp. BLG_1 TaxID=3395883 RepID=UPI001D4866B0|nr:hypothetical protein [Nitrospira sp.]MBX3349628.1 hypothetical protein [Nitrospira sp.]